MDGSIRHILKPEIKSVSIYVVSGSLNQLVSFFLIPFFWQKLTPADYGVIAVTEMIGTFVVIFLGLSLDMSVSRFYYEWPEAERKRRLGAIWIVHWSATLILGSIALGVVGLVSPMLFPDVDFYPYIVFGLISTMLTNLANLTFAVMRIKQMPLFFATYNTVTFFIRMASSIYFVVIADMKLYGYFIANIVSGSLIAAGCAVIMSFFATPTLRNAGMGENLRFSLPLIGYSITSTLSSVADRFMLQYFASMEIVGIYAVSMKFASIISSVNAALKLSYAPFIYKTLAENEENGKRIVSVMNIFYIMPIFLAGLFISFFIKDFVYIVNREEYFQVINVVPLVVGPVIIGTFFGYFAPGLILAKRTNLMWIPSAVQISALLLFGPVLIKYFQLNGIIACNYITASVFFVVAFLMSQKYYYIPVKMNMLLTFIALYIGLVTIGHFIVFYTLTTDILLKLSIVVVSLFIVWNYYLRQKKEVGAKPV